jgi:hypothetical protein
MIRLPAQLELGPYTIHLNVLAARLHQRRRLLRRARVGGAITSVLLVLGWLALPWLRGYGTLITPAYPGEMQLTLDGQALPSGTRQLPVGAYQLTVTQAEHFPAAQELHIARNQTQTLTLPTLRPLPQMQLLPRPHEQSVWQQLRADASGGWRLHAMHTETPESDPARPGWRPAAVTPRSYLLHLNAQGLTRLSILESYPVADEISTTSGARYWAVWEPTPTTYGSGVAGVLTVTTPAGSRTLTTTETVQGVWWAPEGHLLLTAIARDHGLDLQVRAAGTLRASAPGVITVPGVVQSVHWHPTGRAAVVLTALQPPMSQAQPGTTSFAPTPALAVTTNTALDLHAVLIRLPPNEPPEALRLRAPPPRAGLLLPLAWTDEALWWVGDTGLGLALDRVDLATGRTERVSALPDDLVALTVLPHDGTLRIVRMTRSGQLQVERWPDGQLFFVLPHITVTGPVTGTWRGAELLLATSPTELWYVQMSEEALE